MTYEIRVERTTAYLRIMPSEIGRQVIDNYGEKTAVRIAFRSDTNRRWRKFTVVLDGDQTPEDIEQHAQEIVAQYVEKSGLLRLAKSLDKIKP